MQGVDGDSAGRYTVSPWNRDGIAAFEASGHDHRAAFEAALRAVLMLAVERPTVWAADVDGDARAAPIRGEGDDPAALFADLTEDLLVQLDEFGAGVHDIWLDGLLRRDDGGYIAWGYATTGRQEGHSASVRLRERPRVTDDAEGITVRATLERTAGP